VPDLETARAYRLTAAESRQFLDLHAGIPSLRDYLLFRVPPWGITLADPDGRQFIVWFDDARPQVQSVAAAVEAGDLHIIDASGFPRLTSAIAEAEYVPPIEAAAAELYTSVRALSLQRWESLESFLTLAAVLGGVLVLMNFAGAIKGGKS
jgi:hypothetical protein